MAVTLSTTARNLLCDAFVDSLDGGKIKLRATNASGTVLAELTFGTPAFGAAATGVATANAITPDSSANASGTAVAATIHKSDDTQMLDCSVSTSGADINLDNNVISATQEVGLDSLTVTVPAS